MSTLMSRDKPLEKCPRCGATDRFVFNILFRKNYYTCAAILPNGSSTCGRATEISTTRAVTDIGRNIEALIAQKQKTPSAVVESPYWKTPATEPPQPEPTPEPATPAPEPATPAPEPATPEPVPENPTSAPEQPTSVPVQENPTAAPEATTAPTEA
jgi:hypothetical protein